MKQHYRYFHLMIIGLVLALGTGACSPGVVLKTGQNLQLASYIDAINNVSVSINMTRTADGTIRLAATFTPPPGFHLYSKELPRGGKGGQGRPTLLELTDGTRMKALGELTENVSAGPSDYEPDGPLVYPVGPVTLALAVALPDQNGWVEDQLSLTYMACTAAQCLPPTIGKLVQVRIPGAGSITN